MNNDESLVITGLQPIDTQSALTIARDYQQLMNTALALAVHSVDELEKQRDKVNKKTKQRWGVLVHYAGDYLMMCPLRNSTISVLCFEVYDPKTSRSERFLYHASCDLEWSEFYKREWYNRTDQAKTGYIAWLTHLGRYLVPLWEIGKQ